MLYSLLAILAGILIAAQSSLNAVLHPFLGVIGVSFAAQFINALSGLAVRLAVSKRLPRIKVPWPGYLGGFCAIFVLGFSSYLVTKLGAGVTVCLSVSGQLMMSAIVDHYGLFGSERMAFRRERIPGFIGILAGIFIINFAGTDAFVAVENRGMLLFLLAFNIFVGFVTVFARMFNYEASKHVGKIDGSFVSAASGTVGSLALLLIFSGLRPPIEAYFNAPAWPYLTGVVGTAACILNMLCYDKMKIFHATIFLLAGQIAAGILADLLFWGSLPMVKLLGILVVSAGIFWDKKVCNSLI